MNLFRDLQAIRSARNGAPHGYILPNGVVVVWHANGSSNNMATLQHAMAHFPTLVIMHQAA